ncbi:hypothetical protein LEP3755_66000 (plasmid) [Leptolyngbya sp. NIES-3755]|nr:hypothetical protein LEP3755_66000 [Leptolyngbya sp. NIES-3755]
MSNASQPFPHIFLKFVKSGTATPGSFPRPTQQSLANKGDAGGHGGRLKTSVSSIVSDWQTVREQRKQEGKPDLPDAAPLILKVDPQTFDADKLKSFGIEVILELEDGYIIGASADSGLTQLQQKIEKFIREEHGGGGVAQIFEILEGRFGRLECILSEELLARWDQIKDDENYTVEVSIACVGLTSQFSDYPRRAEGETDERYARKIARWSDRRQQTEQQWDDLQWNRQSDFLDFIKIYQPEIIQDASWDDRSHIALLPDSFSCVIEIRGKGLKDLVTNFPFVFDVSEPEQFAEPAIGIPFPPSAEPAFILEPPSLTAPRVCVIDSGMQEKHQYLASAIDADYSQCWIPGESDRTSDDVTGGGHGTRVASAILYPRGLPESGSYPAVCWLQNARVLNRDCVVPRKLNLSEVLNEIVEFYYNRTGTRIFNHSITGSVPCRLQYMSAWAAEMDYLTWRNDILFIVAAGNIPIYRGIGLGVSRRTIHEHFEAGLSYPEYLLQPSSRIANPAQSFQALTVGSISHTTYQVPPIQSIAKEDYPSAFSCSGYGIWDSIKPDVVEYGGDLAMDSGQPPSFPSIPEICPELARSTTGGAPLSDQGAVGTSYAAPKVAHIAAVLAATFPQASCLLYRALIVHSARLPGLANASNEMLAQAIQMMGYGLPNLERALGNAPNRITLVTNEDISISARQAHIYQVQLPPELQSLVSEYDVLIEITLSYKAEPRRTRRNKRKYLSTWLHWQCSQKGESSDKFLERVLNDYESQEDEEGGDGDFAWTLGQQKNYGKMRNISRGTGTVQKDWAIVQPDQLREAFCIAVVGHKGWNNDPTALVPYSLVVSFEVTNANVPVYTSFVEAQVSLQEQAQLEIQQKIIF